LPTVHVLASLPLHFDAADFRGRRRFLFLKGATEEEVLERLLPDTLVIVLSMTLVLLVFSCCAW